MIFQIFTRRATRYAIAPYPVSPLASVAPLG